jgi:uncharacterized protein YndB with AHSA1/START domain
MSVVSVFNPKLDLKLERIVDVPVELVWRAWTEPKHLMPWFCPKPWQTTECEIDLKPGGKFRTLMRGPAGEAHDNTGCYLEVIPHTRLTWTDAVEPGFRPSTKPILPEVLFLTAIIELEPAGPGRTTYTATCLHRDPAARKQHEDIGFFDGWGTALTQLVEYIKTW